MYSEHSQYVDIYKLSEGLVDVYGPSNEKKVIPINENITNDPELLDIYAFPRKDKDYYVFVRVGYEMVQNIQTLIHVRDFKKEHNYGSESNRKTALDYNLKDVNFYDGEQFSSSSTGKWKNIYSTAYDKNKCFYIYDPLSKTNYDLKLRTDQKLGNYNGFLHGKNCKVGYTNTKTNIDYLLVGKFEYGALNGQVVLKKLYLNN